VVVHDLTGTDVAEVRLDLASVPGSGTGDGQADSVVVEGTAGADAVACASFGVGGVRVSGLRAAVEVVGSEPANDTLSINTLAGADVVDASGLAAGVIRLILRGGGDADLLVGSSGDDTLLGGPGNDVLLAGAGDDTFIWNPGDGSDVLEGQAGVDLLIFNGSNVGETIEMSANGSRLRLFRNIGNIAMDANRVEQVRVNALGGADAVTINDLTGTSVTGIGIDLANVPGSGTGDGQADTVSINATPGDDVVVVTGSAGSVLVLGLAATVTIAGSEPLQDRLIVNALAGDDVVEASGLAAGAIRFLADGGTGSDVLIGSDGDDTLFGGPGDDVLIGGPGTDVLDGGPGSNVVIQ
jgi:Ca2+-binding RTX toxin-like protein